MDIITKNIAKHVTTTFGTLIQLIEESLGMSEVTQLDEHLQHLLKRAVVTKTWTEKIVFNVDSFLTPNPYCRFENFVLDKINMNFDKMNNLEYLSMTMLEAAYEFGLDDAAYGSALNKVGLCQAKLGKIERSFTKDVSKCYVQPLQKFLECETNIIMKKTETLNHKRLRLDGLKKQVKKARTMLDQPSHSEVSPEVLLDQAERQLETAQSSFDDEIEVMKLLLEKFSNAQAQHLRYLHEFVEAQARYYAQSHAVMQDLLRELAGTCQPSPLLRVNNKDEDDRTDQNSFINPPLAGSSYVTATFDTDVSKV